MTMPRERDQNCNWRDSPLGYCWLPRLDSHQDIRCQRPAHLRLCNEAMVAREGSAPSISGCRPDVMLFHHQAEVGCLAWICTKSVGVKTRYAAVTPRGSELVARRGNAPCSAD